MKIEDIRYKLTKHVKRKFFIYENTKLLIHPMIKNELIERIYDDINLMPSIRKTIDGCEIKFYKYDYQENIYTKSELLAFIFASINKDFDVVESIDTNSGKLHFYLKCNDIVYDPSLAVITFDNLYNKKYKTIKVIKNSEVIDYIKENNNLYKYYNKGVLKFKNSEFSIHYINNIINRFNNNVNKQNELDEDKIKVVKEHFWINDFILFRQILTCSRFSSLKNNSIAIHPSVDKSVLDEINKYTGVISNLLKKEYKIDMSYYDNTIGNCYALSIMFNLFNKDFKLVQGGMPFKYGNENNYFQHSWLEYKDYVYDPSLRIVTTKDLYYLFLEKQDEYSKEETENMLRRIGFNLTHFRDYLNGVQIGRNETIRYRNSVKNIDSDEYREAGERLISLVKKYK